jgi:hypothetical protein
MKKIKSVLLWVLAFIITVSAAIYQKTTGPTYPKKGNVTIENKTYTFKLLTSHGGTSDAPIEIAVPQNINGTISYRKFRSQDSLTMVPMTYQNGKLVGYLPNQPPAGKLEYLVVLNDNKQSYALNPKPTIIRFKGDVPLGILIPHIFFMFLAMMVSTRTGIEAISKRKQVLLFVKITLVSLFIGGLILGPIVQEYAFGDYWTGWPFGGDWTDNKTIVAFLFWVIAFFVLRKKPQNRLWPIIAFAVLFAVYMIPHSMGGSELDPNTGKVTTGLKK